MAKIKKVCASGVLYGKVKKGEEVLELNGKPLEDILDHIYADSLQDVSIKIIDKKKRQRTLELKKDYDETLGLEFEGLEIIPKTCHNKCVFCFVDQLPCGMRDTLYIKDDDYRLSFISGSYITLTNLKDKDIDRIIEYKLSPLYISVHATNEDLRKKLLGVKKADPILPRIKRLVKSGIVLHTQIVLVPQMNDDKELQKSIIDLYNAGVKSLAVVPVGLTKHRKDLMKIRPVDKALATKTIEQVEKLYEKYPYFCYASDEMYQIADKAVKEYDYYGEFEQIENGVGLIAKFLYEVGYALEYAPKTLEKEVSIVTGVSGLSVMNTAKQMIEKSIKGINIKIFPIKNTFFGDTVTVSGLVTGGDIVRQLENKDIQGKVIIPKVMLKEFGSVFLDGMSVKQVERKIKNKIISSYVDGESFVNTIINGEK